MAQSIQNTSCTASLKVMKKQIKFLLLLLFSVGNYTQNSTGVNFNIAYTLTDKYVLSVCACVQTEHWQIGYGIAAGLGCRQDWKFRFNRTPRSEADVLALGCITQMLPFFFISHILSERVSEGNKDEVGREDPCTYTADDSDGDVWDWFTDECFSTHLP